MTAENESPIFDELKAETAEVPLTPEQEAELLVQTKFPPEEFDLPDQTPEDLGKTDEVSA